MVKFSVVSGTWSETLAVVDAKEIANYLRTGKSNLAEFRKNLIPIKKAVISGEQAIQQFKATHEVPTTSFKEFESYKKALKEISAPKKEAKLKSPALSGYSTIYQTTKKGNAVIDRHKTVVSKLYHTQIDIDIHDKNAAEIKEQYRDLFSEAIKHRTDNPVFNTILDSISIMFESPSGGLKLILALDAIPVEGGRDEKHKIIDGFNATTLSEFTKSIIGEGTDVNATESCKLIFLSYDPEVFLNENAIPLSYDFIEANTDMEKVNIAKAEAKVERKAARNKEEFQGGVKEIDGKVVNKVVGDVKETNVVHPDTSIFDSKFLYEGKEMNGIDYVININNIKSFSPDKKARLIYTAVFCAHPIVLEYTDEINIRASALNEMFDIGSYETVDALKADYDRKETKFMTIYKPLVYMLHRLWYKSERGPADRIADMLDPSGIKSALESLYRGEINMSPASLEAQRANQKIGKPFYISREYRKVLRMKEFKELKADLSMTAPLFQDQFTYTRDKAIKELSNRFLNVGKTVIDKAYYRKPIGVHPVLKVKLSDSLPPTTPMYSAEKLYSKFPEAFISAKSIDEVNNLSYTETFSGMFAKNNIKKVSDIVKFSNITYPTETGIEKTWNIFQLMLQRKWGTEQLRLNFNSIDRPLESYPIINESDTTKENIYNSNFVYKENTLPIYRRYNIDAVAHPFMEDTSKAQFFKECVRLLDIIVNHDIAALLGYLHVVYNSLLFRKVPVVPIIYNAKRGIGKDFTINVFLKGILGVSSVVNLEGAESIEGKFRDLGGVNVGVLSEASELKGPNFRQLITGNNLKVEKKYQLPYEVENRINFFLFSNEQNVFKMGTSNSDQETRRYLFIPGPNFSNEINTDIFGEIAKIYEAEGGKEEVFAGILNLLWDDNDFSMATTTYFSQRGKQQTPTEDNAVALIESWLDNIEIFIEGTNAVAQAPNDTDAQDNIPMFSPTDNIGINYNTLAGGGQIRGKRNKNLRIRSKKEFMSILADIGNFKNRATSVQKKATKAFIERIAHDLVSWDPETLNIEDRKAWEEWVFSDADHIQRKPKELIYNRMSRGKGGTVLLPPDTLLRAMYAQDNDVNYYNNMGIDAVKRNIPELYRKHTALLENLFDILYNDVPDDSVYFKLNAPIYKPVIDEINNRRPEGKKVDISNMVIIG